MDGVVAIAHTEGGGTSEPNNAQEVLKALAGFMVHPNVAAVLAVDFGVEPISNRRLQEFLHEHRYPIDHVPHQFLSLTNGVSAGLHEGESIIRSWLESANVWERTPQPLSGLKVALQCGGSDAFSGVSGNPLAGAMVHELIRHGGTGVLTETDEVVGAEAYVLRNVRDLETAKKFLGVIEDFKAYLAWHGVSSESNPSGGNKFRGLYNIALKSVGAVHKKDPRTPLDFVTHYAEPVKQPGFYFMNGPGNDLEGIAGQVAAGCNLILFVTGNGSVTNFPFVPTLKITTTTRRHQLLIREMDINAGEYLDGMPFNSMTDKAFETLLATASGERTRGELAGHSQVSLWRNWPQTDTSRLSILQAKPQPNGVPNALAMHAEIDAVSQNVFRRPIRLHQTQRGLATDRIGLVLPLSLCSSQVGNLAADRLNQSDSASKYGLSRFIALPHTEACGSSGESLFQLLHRSYQGYVMHPNVAAAFLLEHGCEKITNDAMQHDLQRAQIDTEQFGWASVQLDGGIAKVTDRIQEWFELKLQNTCCPNSVSGTLGQLNLGLLTTDIVTASTAIWLAHITRAVVQQGGSVMIPDTDSLWTNAAYRTAVLGKSAPQASLAYGERIVRPGLHLVDSETEHWVENLTCMGACGAHAVLGVVSDHARQSHPMIPVVQCAESRSDSSLKTDDVDYWLTGNLQSDLDGVEDLLVRILHGETQSQASRQSMIDFQFARGLLGVTS
jgi:altronate dehydratase